MCIAVYCRRVTLQLLHGARLKGSALLYGRAQLAACMPIDVSGSVASCQPASLLRPRQANLQCSDNMGKQKFAAIHEEQSRPTIIMHQTAPSTI